MTNSVRTWKWPVYSRFTHLEWWISLVMLVYQRVSLNLSHFMTVFRTQVLGGEFHWEKLLKNPSLFGSPIPEVSDVLPAGKLPQLRIAGSIRGMILKVVSYPKNPYKVVPRSWAVKTRHVDAER